jgi:hypothetical protein
MRILGSSIRIITIIITRDLSYTAVVAPHVKVSTARFLKKHLNDAHIVPMHRE